MKSMRKVQLLLCMLLMMGTFVMRAQDQRSAVDVLVDVIVVDKQGDGLPGATVKVTGRPVAVVSNLDGRCLYGYIVGIRSLFLISECNLESLLLTNL